MQEENGYHYFVRNALYNLTKESENGTYSSSQTRFIEYLNENYGTANKQGYGKIPVSFEYKISLREAYRLNVVIRKLGLEISKLKEVRRGVVCITLKRIRN